LLIGEWDASVGHIETAARWKYVDYFIATARSEGIATVMWDNGEDQFDRSAHMWRDPTLAKILIDENKGIANSLADSTTDWSATSQNTSAFLFHQYGTDVADTTLSFLLNGNSLQSIASSSGILTSGTDYVLSDNDITFTTAFLSKYLSPTTAPGVLGELTLTFSGGAPLIISIVQWDSPTLGSSSSAASSVSSGVDLSIPITWAGVSQLATVKAELADGGFLVDDWTVYYGPLMDHRTVSCHLQF
jgi:endoglucanase